MIWIEKQVGTRSEREHSETSEFSDSQMVDTPVTASVLVLVIPGSHVLILEFSRLNAIPS